MDTSVASTEEKPSHYMLTGRFIMDVFCVIVIYNANNTFLMIAFDHTRDQGESTRFCSSHFVSSSVS